LFFIFIINLPPRALLNIMEINLDLRPLMFMTAAIFWLLAVVTFLMGKAQAPVKGTREWAIGNFVSGTGMCLFGFNSFIPDFFTIVLSTTFIVLGICYFLAGLWEFKEKPYNYLIFIGLPAFTFLQSVLFTNIFNFYELRKILLTLAIITGMVTAAIETYIPARRPLLIALRIIAISSTIYTFLMIVRLVSIFKDPTSTPLHGSYMNMCIWVMISVLQILDSIGFLLMFLYKQSMQLQSSLIGMQRFFSILAHELRGPLGTISMIAGELSNRSERYPEDQRLIIEAMKKSSANTFNLLENLLEWGRNLLGDLHPQPIGFSLSQVLTEEVELAKTQALTKQIQIKEDIAPEILVFADEQMCHTIARNLLSNAIKFTPEGGSIRISAEQSIREALFMVSDTGIGISQEIIRELSEAHPVSSLPGTKGEKGFGLGLSFSRNLVEKNHGEMTIQSELGKGTSIRVKLPLYHEHHPKH
jgi:two-component system sensor histidine kinase/response regulator